MWRMRVTTEDEDDLQEKAEDTIAEMKTEILAEQTETFSILRALYKIHIFSLREKTE